ncbi:MAG: lysylphosphatidylglycerol synthase domain-containing protein [Polyangiales bacterium]
MAPRHHHREGLGLRALGAAVALGVLAIVLRSVGGPETLAALRRARSAMPWVLAREGVGVVVNGLALRALYRAAGRPAPERPLWRAVLVGHLAAVTLPAGRLLAEGWKAAQVAPHTGAPVAAAAAVALQAAALYANAVAACVTTVAVLLRCGWTTPTFAVMAFGVGMIALATALALAGRVELGRRLGGRMEAVREAGPAFDGALGEVSKALHVATAWEVVGRAMQCLQLALLRDALGAAVGAVDSLATYGLLLTGAALGDLLPAQLGATDAALALGARALGMLPADGLAITLSLHAAQVLAAAILAASAWRALR